MVAIRCSQAACGFAYLLLVAHVSYEDGRFYSLTSSPEQRQRNKKRGPMQEK